MSDLFLKDKIVVITGAGGVICSEIARELWKSGAKLALLNRTLEKAQKIADEIKQKVSQWKSVAEKIGLTRASIMRMENCFNF